MKKPKRFGRYKCPYNKDDGKTQRPFDIGGRYCRNNCEIYKRRECKKFKAR